MSHLEEIKDDLETLKEIILQKVPTDQIWLFGSYAYGTSLNYDFKVINLIDMILIIHANHINHNNHSSDEMKDDAQSANWTLCRRYMVREFSGEQKSPLTF